MWSASDGCQEVSDRGPSLPVTHLTSRSLSYIEELSSGKRINLYRSTSFARSFSIASVHKMSETTTRTTGQKRKRDDAASVQSPAGGNAQRHAIADSLGSNIDLDPNNFQNGSFYMGHPQNGYNPALMAMQATILQAQTAAAMAASGSGTATPSGAHRAKDSGNADRTNFNQLKDAMSMGGVSLREEEDYLNQRGQIPSSSYSGDNRSRTQDFIPHQFLVSLFKTVAKHHKLQGITQDVITLAGLAVEQRLRSLVEKANVASNHRWETQTEINAGNTIKKEADEEEKERVSMYADGKTPVFDRNLRRDVGKQLLAIE
ncbi:16431_t:CDS:2, partial [Acaulospora colombiana]